MRTRVIVPICLAGVTLMLTSVGCKKRLRGIEIPGQVLLDKGKAVLQETGAVEAIVAPVSVPWASKSGPIGFNVNLVNLSDQPIRLELADIELEDALGRLMAPLSPERLLRAFGAEATGGRSAQRVSHRHHHSRRRHYVRRHYYRRHYYGYSLGYGWPYHDYWAVGGWSFGGSYYDDPYAEARRTGRFLSELLVDQSVAPRHVANGHVVFPYRLHSDDQVTVLIHLETTAAPSDSGGDIESADGRTTLTFRFEER